MFLLGCYVPAVVSHAGEKKADRTLAQIVDLVFKEGKEKTIDEETGKNLGFPGEVKIKSMRYRSNVCPDGQEHAFNVVVSTAFGGKSVPTDVLFRPSKLTTKESSRLVEAWALRLSPSGKLSNAVLIKGEVGVEVIHTIQAIDSPDVKRVFEKEMKFFLGESSKLVFSK